MNKEEFKKEMEEKLAKIEVKLNDKQIEQFYQYMVLLLDWNEKINLTAIIEPKEIILKHFIDSLTIEKQLKLGETLIDVGTGAGFPGIPIKIARPDVNIVLLDSLNKRILFLNEVISKLKLEKIETIHARVEEAGKNKKYREKFDVATSRAVANLTTLTEYLLPLVKRDGRAICMKGPGVEKEIEESKKAIDVLGGKIESVESFQLADTDNQRNIVYIEKIKNTPAKYPRKPGTPSKEPIS